MKINPDGSRNVTIKELAAHLGEEYVTVASLVKFLANQGIVTEQGKETLPAGTRGKPSSIYNVPNNVELYGIWDEPEVIPVEVVTAIPEVKPFEAKPFVESPVEVGAVAA